MRSLECGTQTANSGYTGSGRRGGTVCVSRAIASEVAERDAAMQEGTGKRCETTERISAYWPVSLASWHSCFRSRNGSCKSPPARSLRLDRESMRSNHLAIFLSLALTALGVALACPSALLDARRLRQRGRWLAVLLVGVVVSVVGIWLLSANDVWLDLGAPSGSLAPATSQVSVAALCFPAALASAVAALLALVRRRSEGRPGVA